MSFAQDHIDLFSTIPLQSLFPGGMFDSSDNAGGENASRALMIIESLILESTASNALLSKYALLQSFPRIQPDPDATTAHLHDEPEEIDPEQCRKMATSLAPDWYSEFIATLDETEAELFLKAYLLGHETWGHADGIGLLVRLVAEHASNMAVPVRVDRLHGEERKIPDHLQSRLGVADARVTLGSDFALGRRFFSRPERYHIRVGPVSMRTLEKLQDRGWAVETRPSPKLERLVEFASPFYFHAKIHIMIETIGCVLGRATLGGDRLGTVVSDRDLEVDTLVGVS